MLSASSLDSENTTTAATLIKALWLAGLFLDVFGVLATIFGQWFEPLFDERDRKARLAFSDIAFTLVAGGVILFLIGLVIYAWPTLQPLLVSVM